MSPRAGARLSGPPAIEDPYGPSSRFDKESVRRIFDIRELVDDIEEHQDSDRTEDEYAIFTMSKMDVGRFWVNALTVVAAVCFTAGAVAGARMLFEVGDGHPLRSGAGQEQQRLLEIAEKVVSACDVDDPNENSSDCLQLCEAKMCCFDKGEGSCLDEKRENCVVYVGCEALLPEDRKWS